MRKAARAIVIKDGKLLVMHRNKFGQEYETLPGGALEAGEAPEHAAIREVNEETTVVIKNVRLVFVEEAGDPFGTQYIYLAEYVSGEPKLRADSEEMHITRLGQNLYEPRWVRVSDLPALPFVSDKLKSAILECVANGFPAEPIQIK